MTWLRTRAFTVAFYVTTAAFLVLGSPLLFAPRTWAMAGLRLHAHTCLWLLRIIAGTRFELRGREHLPQGPALIVSKHQSVWETFAMITVLRDPAIVLKAELTRIPLYGSFCKKFAHILVERNKRAQALKAMTEAARLRLADRRDILIFAEGTRVPPDAPPAYKPGFLSLYETLAVPLVPVALNSGVFWPPRGSLERTGTIIVEIGPPVEPGLSRVEVKRNAVDWIETRTAALVAEARGALGQAEPPRVSAPGDGAPIESAKNV
ncbi:MAG: lysophospholipid acyltransferase family protein [Hyphomicrobiaceae bacterium]